MQNDAPMHINRFLEWVSGVETALWKSLKNCRFQAKNLQPAAPDTFVEQIQNYWPFLDPTGRYFQIKQ